MQLDRDGLVDARSGTWRRLGRPALPLGLLRRDRPGVLDLERDVEDVFVAVEVAEPAKGARVLGLGPSCALELGVEHKDLGGSVL